MQRKGLREFLAHVVGLGKRNHVGKAAVLDHPVAPLVSVRSAPSVIRRGKAVKVSIRNLRENQQQTTQGEKGVGAASRQRTLAYESKLCT